jgi:hypothetical protein
MRNLIFAAFVLIPTAARADHLDEGLRALIASDYPKAERALAWAVHERPNDANARFNYASALRGMGRNEEAIAQYQTAVSCASDPKVRSDAFYGIALARQAEGNPVAERQAWHDFLAQAGPNDQGAVTIARQNLSRAEASIPRIVR